ncbi:MAG: YerC/YecD family TrpR-related protein [Acidimicrobiia bacterium]|nr:YerC/YecD family TrpR-related protein [Acidimicrobiia bacterium]
MVTRDEDWQDDDAIALFDAFTRLDTADQAADFLRDLCTRRELTEMASRWRIVRLLDTGLSYRDISAETGVSTATVTRVAQWLHHGRGGYASMIERTRETS